MFFVKQVVRLLVNEQYDVAGNTRSKNKTKSSLKIGLRKIRGGGNYASKYGNLFSNERKFLSYDN